MLPQEWNRFNEGPAVGSTASNLALAHACFGSVIWTRRPPLAPDNRLMRPLTLALLSGVSLAATAGAQAPCTKAVTACERWILWSGGPSRSMVYASYPLDQRNENITRALIMVHGAGRNA